MQMKKPWMVMCIVTGLSLVIGACGTAITPPSPAATDASVKIEQSEEPISEEAGVPADAHPVVEAIPVGALPTIDGNASDAEWEGAAPLQDGILTMKAVYDKENIAFLMVWDDRDLSINTRGTWNWDPEAGTWWKTGQDKGKKWESFNGSRHPEWVNVAFDISSKVKSEGCAAFCHEYPPGSGIWHHQTDTAGEYIDSWFLLAKHGFGPQYYEDQGWLNGVRGVEQEGPLQFDIADDMDSHQLLNGNITFFGYAEDKVMSSPDDMKFTDRDQPGDKYCRDCHTASGLSVDPLERDFTFADAGEIMYSPNYDPQLTTPIYIEKAPASFADSMVLTQDEVDNGEAIALEGLSKTDLNKYWAAYKVVNGVVPQLVLKVPSGSQADVLVAANWNNGVWTVEFTRKLVTGYEDDIQFSDLTKDYPFGVSLWTHSTQAPLLGSKGGLLRFAY
jgi:hypothetical protein